MSFYISGLTEDKRPLLAGVWRMKHQEGFPVEMSHLLVRDRGYLIDWMEAMADASIDNNLPILWGEIEQFLTQDQQIDLQIRFMTLLKQHGGNYTEIVRLKKARGDECHEWMMAQIAVLQPLIENVKEGIKGLVTDLNNP